MKPNGRQAFTLVEVTISLFILSFCLIILLGLFNVGLTSERRSTDDTTLAALVLQAANTLRTQNLAAGYATNFYFDNSGQLLTNSMGAMYHCSVTTANLPASQAPQPALDTHLLIASLQFTWPANVPNPPHTNTAYATLPP